MLPQFQNLDLRPRSPRNESVLRGSWHRLRGRCVVVLFLLLLFMFRHLLLFVLFFVFLAALVSHACSFSDCALKSGSLRRQSSLPSSRSGRVTAAEPRFLVSLHVQFFITPRPRASFASAMSSRHVGFGTPSLPICRRAGHRKPRPDKNRITARRSDGPGAPFTMGRHTPPDVVGATANCVQVFNEEITSNYHGGLLKNVTYACPSSTIIGSRTLPG